VGITSNFRAPWELQLDNQTEVDYLEGHSRFGKANQESEAQMSKSEDAFKMAAAASKLDFANAVMGLMSGHADIIRDLENRLHEKDRAFLMALALCKKGSRVDPDGVMVETISKGLGAGNLCGVERDFLTANQRDTQND
jgi:hypothetical protein